MRIALYVVVAMLGGFVILMAMHWPSEEKSRLLGKQAAAEKMCDQMLSDDAPGSQRRMTREICDKLKAHIREELDQAK